MTCHSWYDDDFDFGKLDRIQRNITDAVYKRTLCKVYAKEKYGTIRYQLIFAPGTSVRYGFHITLPYFKRKSTWVEGGVPIVLFVWCQCWLVRKWTRWAWKVLRQEAVKAAEQNPDMKDEILEDMRIGDD